MEGDEGVESGGAADPRSDEDLMAQVSADHSALDVLMIRHQAWLLRYLNGVLRNPARAEEVAQDAWIKVWRASTYDPTKGRFPAYLRRIALNAALDQIPGPGEAMLPANTPPPRAAAFGVVPNIEVFRECLESLPADARKAVRRCVIEEEPFAEVAEGLGVSEQTLRRLCNRAIRSIQSCMRKKGYPPGRHVICEDPRFEVSVIDTTPSNPDAYDVVVWTLDPSVGRCGVIVSLTSGRGADEVSVELNEFTFDGRRFGDCHKSSLGKIANALGAVRASVEIRP
jgi:RNA polymerase sigma-70 factor (ECF subfamily)